VRGSRTLGRVVAKSACSVPKVQAPNTSPNGFVFATAAGTEPTQDNIRLRVLDKAVEKANQKLTEAGDVPLPEGLTPHKLRHTFASILVALGVDLVSAECVPFGAHRRSSE
jgi:integrase